LFNPRNYLTASWDCGIIYFTKGSDENEYVCEVVREPAEVVRAGQQHGSKIISEPRAET
jgi:hypothetical protein